MNSLSVSQKYVLCAMNRKGVIGNANMAQQMSVIAACLIELMQKGYIYIEETKIYRNEQKNLESRDLYLLPLYKYISQSEKPLKAKVVAEHYTASFTDRAQKEVFDSIKTSLIVAGCMEEIEERSLFSKKQYVVSKQEAVQQIMEEIRKGILEDGDNWDEAAVLAALLEKGQLLKIYFSKEEIGRLREKLKLVKENPANQIIRQMMEQLDLLLAAVMVPVMT